MATSSTSSVPDVRVTQVEAGEGFVITCSKCPRFRTIRKHRIDADLTATGHVRSHARPFDDDEDD